MKNEEIEAAREAVLELFAAYHTRVGVDSAFEAAARKAFDAICAAARGDSLVGKRAPEIKPNFTPVKLEALVVCTDCGAVHAADCRRNTLDRNGPQTGACPVCGNPSIRPLDFEVLEGGEWRLS